MDSGKLSKIRTLFIALLLFLPLQYGYVGIIGEIHSEPWPAFVFPGFKKVYSTDNHFEINQQLFRLHFDDREGTKEVMPQDLFPELPLSQISGFMRTHFRDSVSVENLSDDASIWLYRISGEYIGENVLRIEVVNRTNRFLKSDEGIIFDSVLKEELIEIPKSENE